MDPIDSELAIIKWTSISECKVPVEGSGAGEELLVEVTAPVWPFSPGADSSCCRSSGLWRAEPGWAPGQGHSPALPSPSWGWALQQRRVWTSRHGHSNSLCPAGNTAFNNSAIPFSRSQPALRTLLELKAVANLTPLSTWLCLPFRNILTSCIPNTVHSTPGKKISGICKRWNNKNRQQNEDSEVRVQLHHCEAQTLVLWAPWYSENHSRAASKPQQCPAQPSGRFSVQLWCLLDDLDCSLRRMFENGWYSAKIVLQELSNATFYFSYPCSYFCVFLNLTSTFIPLRISKIMVFQNNNC